MWEQEGFERFEVMGARFVGSRGVPHWIQALHCDHAAQDGPSEWTWLRVDRITAVSPAQVLHGKAPDAEPIYRVVVAADGEKFFVTPNGLGRSHVGHAIHHILALLTSSSYDAEQTTPKFFTRQEDQRSADSN
jgi:hypothetical protein